MAVIVGLPVNIRSRLFNCAAVLQNGEVKGIVPKTYLPNGNEFYETRWFVGARTDRRRGQAGIAARFAPDLLFDMGDFTFAVEICEDLWTPRRPRAAMRWRARISSSTPARPTLWSPSTPTGASF